jgi:hypothetical protein
MYVDIQIPDISEYPKGFPSFWPGIIIGQVSPIYQVQALTTTYVRLVEAALVEYRLGATKLREFWNDHSSFNIGAANRSISHFESCLSDVYRATHSFRSLRNKPDSVSVMLRREKATFASDKSFDRLRLIRNTIHHLDDQVNEGKIQEGQPMALMPNGPETLHPTEPNQTIKTIDRLIIGPHELLFSELASFLIEMGHYAEKIAEFRYQPSAS